MAELPTWQRPADYLPLHSLARAGRYLRPFGVNSTLTLTVNRLYLAPLLIPRFVSVDQVAINVTTAAAGAIIRLALLADRDGMPDTVIDEYGSVSGAAIATPSIAVDKRYGSGLYWAGIVAQVAAPNVDSQQGFGFLPRDNVNAGQAGSLTIDGIAGAIPSPVVWAGGSSQLAPAMGLRIA